MLLGENTQTLMLPTPLVSYVSARLSHCEKPVCFIYVSVSIQSLSPSN